MRFSVARGFRPALAALVVAAFAFLLYHRTLVPGMDLGDSASFQTDAGSPLLTPRQGYPLYFAINLLSVRLLVPEGGEPAYVVNLTSAVCGAGAAAVLTVLVSGMTQSVLAGAFSGLLLAASYTFWSQCITAEVYALHMMCIGLTLVTLGRWAAAPTLSRLALAFAVYAIAFGNHLSMILLAPALVLFVAAAHPQGWRGLVQGPTLAVAAAAALAGAAQYAWNVAGMLAMPDVPRGLDLLGAFWFDVTKTDWRESMVLAAPISMLPDRAAMYWFDLRQQFGLAGIAIAVIGAIALRRRRGADWVLVSAVYLANWIFAFTYNVGDVHVFFLPSHLMVAVAAGYGVSATIEAVRARAWRRPAIALLTAGFLIYPVWRAHDTFPAVDRSRDRRGEQLLDALTRDLHPDRAVFAADLNWQLQNGLSYYGKYRKPDLQYFRAADRLLAFPVLVHDNGAIGRRVYLSADAGRRISSAFGSLYAIDPDPAIDVRRIAAIADTLPAGTPYVLCLLTPYRDRPVDPSEPHRIVSILSDPAASDVPAMPLNGYSVVAGVKGRKPVLFRAAAKPFRTSARLPSHHVVIRLDGWLAYDTIRRADFGHVIADGVHALGVDRGLSFVAWPDGAAPIVAYESSLYADQPRFILRPGR